MEKIMASFGNVEIDQGRSFTRLLLFCGSKFARWKKLMQIFIKDHHHESLGRLSPRATLYLLWRKEIKLFQPRSTFTY